MGDEIGVRCPTNRKHYQSQICVCNLLFIFMISRTEHLFRSLYKLDMMKAGSGLDYTPVIQMISGPYCAATPTYRGTRVEYEILQNIQRHLC